jgi:Ca2+-transporting ATPase
VFEAESEEPFIMDRPPRSLEKPLIGRHELIISVIEGFCVLAVSLVSYQISSLRSFDESHSRTVAFTTLIIANLGLIMSGRSWKYNIISAFKIKNTALWLVICGSLFFLLLVLFVPALREVFHFEAINGYDLLLCLSGGVITISLFEIFKLFNRGKTRDGAI